MLTIGQKYGNPYAYAYTTAPRTMNDREKVMFVNAVVANWESIKDEKAD